MPYETSAGLPTRGLTYAKLLENLRECQELTAMMAHLVKAEGTVADEALGNGWIVISELLKRLTDKVTAMTMHKLN